MNPADQLARIAASKPPAPVRIVLLDRGYSVWQWLCGKHVQAAQAAGWEVKESKDPPHELACDWRNRSSCGDTLERRDESQCAAYAKRLDEAITLLLDGTALTHSPIEPRREWQMRVDKWLRVT